MCSILPHQSDPVHGFTDLWKAGFGVLADKVCRSGCHPELLAKSEASRSIARYSNRTPGNCAAAKVVVAIAPPSPAEPPTAASLRAKLARAQRTP
jgi:hypothetical protein